MALSELAFVQWLVGLAGNWETRAAASAAEYRVRVFKGFVEPVLEQLTLVHQDYTRNLSQLAANLEAKELPPRELVEWLRSARLQQRATREELMTADAELRGLDFERLARGTGENDHTIAQFCRDYVNAILAYFSTCAGPTELSFYRHFEQALRSRIARAEAHGETPATTAAFYEQGHVQDMAEALRNTVDNELPRSWMAVRRRYGALWAALGSPA